MNRISIIVIRTFLGLLFLAAGIPKVGVHLQTLAAVYSYQIVLPDWLATAVAYGLPWVEIILGIALLSGFFLPLTLAATAGMLLAFTALTAQAWWRELPIDCGCLDLSVLHPSLAALTTPGGATLRNIFLLGLTALLAWLACSLRAGTTKQI
jgi:uncharacterized membrane protein YphA (DoxX/SURF4 family)